MLLIVFGTSFPKKVWVMTSLLGFSQPGKTSFFRLAFDATDYRLAFFSHLLTETFFPLLYWP